MTRRPWLALTALWTLLCVVTVLWVSIDRRPPEWDHANHLERTLACYHTLAEGGADRFRAALVGQSAFYPTLVTCAAGLLYFLFPSVPLTAQAVMLAFLGVALVAIFALGRALWDAETGLLAAFFFATAPFVVFSLTNFQLDLPLAAMVALALYVLHRSDGFSRVAWSVALGLVIGLGLLTKPPFPVYVLPSLLWSLWSAGRGPDRRRRLALLALALVIGMILALPWYGPRLLGLPFQFLDRSFRQAAEAGQAEALTSTSLLFYPRIFPAQFGLLAGVLCAWGLWALRRQRAARAYLWLAALVPFLLFTLIQNKNLRYTLPILPAAALVAAAGARSVRPAWKPWLIGACIAMGALQVSMTTFALPRPPRVAASLTPLVISFPPSPAEWQHDRILDDLASASGGRPATVAVVPNHNFLSVSNLRYEALRRGLPVRMTRAWSGPPFGIDFMVVKTGSQGPAFTAGKLDRIMGAFASDPYLADTFPVIQEYPLPDGSRAMLRVRRIRPLRGVAPADVAGRLEAFQERLPAEFVRDAAGVHVSVDYRPEAILRGEVDAVRIEAAAATVGELARRDRAPLHVRDVRVRAERVLVNPWRLMESGALEVLDIGAVRIEGLAITQPDLDEFLHGQPPAAGLRVELLDGWARVTHSRLALSGRVALLPGAAGAPFAVQVEQLRLGSIAIPGFFVDWATHQFDPALRLRNLPVDVSLAPIRIRPGRVEVGSGAR